MRKKNILWYEVFVVILFCS